MSPTSAAKLLTLLDELPLLPRSRREQLAKSDLPAEAEALAELLRQKGWLTAYQAAELLAGNGRDLVLDQHLLLEPIGEGGMGRVFKARHLRLERLEAVKVLRPEWVETTEAVGRFLREARAVARLDHPHVVRIHDAGEAGGRHFLAMEFVSGINLADLVERDGPMSPAGACYVLYQAAQGLQHAHEADLVHRDIKPHNLLLAGEVTSETPPSRLVLKILDLGLARVREAGSTLTTSLTPSGLVMGTPDYIAPEQARNVANADIRSDLYSLGCTAYHLLAGHPPYLGGGMMEKLLRHQTEPPPPLGRVCPEAPARLAAVVEKLMAKQPCDRFQTPAELAKTLKPLLRTTERSKSKRKPSSAPPLPPAPTIPTPMPTVRDAVPSPAPPAPRQGLPAGWLLLGGLAAITIAGGLVAWWLRTR